MNGQTASGGVPLPAEYLAQVESRLAAARAEAPGPWSRALAEPRVVDSLPFVWTCSEFVATSCCRDAGLLAGLVERGLLFAPLRVGALRAEIDAMVSPDAGESELLVALRRFRRLHTLRIAWRDLAGWADLAQTLCELSDLADACIDFACRRARDLLTRRHGEPRGRTSGEVQPLVVLGMGKLGGGELNFSSDIDLVFLFPETGATDGQRSIENEEFFLRLGQKLIQLLARVTVDGFAYRVDMRLRPFGDSGPLAVSFDAFENYLQQHGRDWERYAYVKARPVTGKEHFDALYREVLRPFVYRRYLDFGVFESLRGMKEMIAREVARRELRDHIKLGPGGIREIEFIAQAHQLIRGGSDPRLQSRRLLDVLPQLGGQKLLGERAVAELAAAYRYLRVVENRLQEWNDEQTHLLPETADGRRRLALALGQCNWADLARLLEHHRTTVAGYFEEVVFGPVSSARERLGVLGDLLEMDSGSGLRREALVALGFAQPAGIIAAIDGMRESGYYRRLDETGRRRLQALLPRMLALIVHATPPEQVLGRLLKIIEMIGGRTVYLALLYENAPALERLVELCAHSQFLADQIASHPLLLDELIDERLFVTLPDRRQFERDLLERMAGAQEFDPEREIELLKQFQRAAVFRVAVADLTGRLPIMKVSDRLTDIAELIVVKALEFAWAQLTAKHGLPRCGDEPQRARIAGLVVVAYGKFGGYELGYGSDLDLVFLHDSTGDYQRTDGATTLDNSVFFARLAQRLMHLLTVHGPAGRLYEVDTRLRPSGKGGLLVQSLSGFASYQREEAWTWEHQALLRARAVAGTPEPRGEFERIRLDILQHAIRRETLREEVSKMRERMRNELSRAGAGEFDLKQDPGGIGDIEFLAQYWALEFAARHPEVVTFPDTIRVLETLASGDIVPQSTIDVLVEAYRCYRRRLHHLSLDRGRAPVPDSEFREERNAVLGIWKQVFGGGG